MQTFQDFEKEASAGRVREFITTAINKHRGTEDFKAAVIADEYDKQQNTTIREMVRTIYTAAGVPVEDITASNNRIASNFFKRLNTQRCTYSLGNGVTFDEDGIKEKLGIQFDTDLYWLAYAALKHGVSFGFWNVDKLHCFPLTQFVPLYDETDGRLRAGIRFWSLEWGKRPVTAVLYEEDGYTEYRSESGSSMGMVEVVPKRAYRQTVQHTAASGDEIIGEQNYGTLPIVPLFGNTNRQSTLVGLRSAIDSYDMIQSGFANDLTDCAQVYWIVGNAMGMDDKDLQRFIDRIKLAHIAVADTDNSSVTPYTQEVPYTARQTYLSMIERAIYRDFGAFNPTDITSKQVTATEIKSAYQPMDEEADDFEYQIIQFLQQILALQGLEGTPQFKRNRIANQMEQVEMIMLEADHLDDEAILELLPNITPEMAEAILARRMHDEQRRFVVRVQENAQNGAVPGV